MKTIRIAAATAVIGLAALAFFSPTHAQPDLATLLFENGRACAPAQTGRPVHIPVTTKSPLAQACFNQGMCLTYGFNHAEAARAFPDDDTIQVLFAEALMDLSLWNYWDAGGAWPRHRTAEMVDALERMEVYRQRGDDAALAATRKRFATTWLGKPGGPALSLL